MTLTRSEARLPLRYTRTLPGMLSAPILPSKAISGRDEFKTEAVSAIGRHAPVPRSTLQPMTGFVDPPRDIASSGEVDLYVQYNFYYLEAGGDRDGTDTPSQDGLAFGGPSWLGIVTGTDFAPLPCRVEILRRMPPHVDRRFDMAAEHDLQIVDGYVKLTGPHGQMPHLWLATEPGLHRCRIHARNRTQGLQAIAPTGPAISRVNPENHYIQIWPSLNARAPEVLYGPDDFARSYR